MSVAPPEVCVLLDSASWLLSPLATVYLPVRAGHLDEVLSSLLAQDEDITGIARELEQFLAAFRDEKFPPTSRRRSTAREIASPRPWVGTKLGDSEWRNGWEAPPRLFDILDEWAEVMPTDGVHVEAVLGSCDGTSELRRAQLLAEVREREAGAAVQEAQSGDITPPDPDE